MRYNTATLILLVLDFVLQRIIPFVQPIWGQAFCIFMLSVIDFLAYNGYKMQCEIVAQCSKFKKAVMSLEKKIGVANKLCSVLSYSAFGSEIQFWE